MTELDRRETDRHRTEVEAMIAAEDDPKERLKLLLWSKMLDLLIDHSDDLATLKKHRDAEVATNNSSRGIRQVVAWLIPTVQLGLVGAVGVMWTFAVGTQETFARLNLVDARTEGRINVTEVRLAAHDGRITHLEEVGENKK